jgi:DtxR family transcriptional regulator, Mn-dependent transcriptional regulator
MSSTAAMRGGHEVLAQRMHSAAEQDYLKAIYKLQQETGRATTQALAVRLGVKPSSVTAMMKHLAAAPDGPYVTHTPYRGVTLTPRGEAVALETVRYHLLLELFLATQLDVPWDRVHAEAERLEHVISDDLAERIAAKLGHPRRDPHGDPIPRRDGTVVAADDVPLDALEAGARGTVARVLAGEPELLQYLGTLGIVPGTTITVEAVTLCRDVRIVRIGEATNAVGGEIARRVRMHPVGDDSPDAPVAAGDSGRSGADSGAQAPTSVGRGQTR